MGSVLGGITSVLLTSVLSLTSSLTPQEQNGYVIPAFNRIIELTN
jgi:hypothetical protein